MDAIIECPVCNENVHITEMFFHVMFNHPAFFSVWAAVNFPTNPDILFDEEHDYEYYERLCEELGNVPVGVSDIAQVTETHAEGIKCPICLEETEDNLKITACLHAFCKPCLTTWLGAHHICPMCKQEAQQAQILPTSTSDPSSSENPPGPSANTT